MDLNNQTIKNLKKKKISFKKNPLGKKLNSNQLDVLDLKVIFEATKKEDNFLAVENINFSVLPGERFALVGESGSGKTVTAMSILKLLSQAKTFGHHASDNAKRALQDRIR